MPNKGGGTKDKIKTLADAVGFGTQRASGSIESLVSLGVEPATRVDVSAAGKMVSLHVHERSTENEGNRVDSPVSCGEWVGSGRRRASFAVGGWRLRFRWHPGTRNCPSGGSTGGGRGSTLDRGHGGG